MPRARLLVQSIFGLWVCVGSGPCGFAEPKFKHGPGASRQQVAIGDRPRPGGDRLTIEADTAKKYNKRNK